MIEYIITVAYPSLNLKLFLFLKIYMILVFNKKKLKSTLFIHYRKLHLLSKK